MAKIKYHLPPRMERIWNWVVALDAWDLNQPSLLADLVRRNDIPEELVEPISEIIAGSRKPNYKAAAKLRIPAYTRLDIARLLYDSRHSCEQAKTKSDAHADALRLETKDFKAQIEKEARDWVTTLALNTGVSEKTIESYYRVLVQKIKDWPKL